MVVATEELYPGIERDQLKLYVHCKFVGCFLFNVIGVLGQWG